MEMKDIQRNMKFIFGPNLREVPISKIDTLYGMIEMKDELKKESLSDEERGKWNSNLGFFLRIVGELEESEKHLQTAIQIYTDIDNEEAAFSNQLRLAHTYQWWTKFDKSNQMFQALLEKAESDEALHKYLDFVYQHCGKNEFDQKRFPEAIEYFKKALDIRKEKNEEELIKQTETAIEACEYRIENGMD